MFRVLIFILLLAIPASAKQYQGAAWVEDVCKYYSGSAWVDCTKNRYDGASWVEIEIGAPACSGTYGYDSSPTDCSLYVSTGRIYLQKTTIDCSATSGTWHFFIKYVANANNEYTPLIYDSSGDLVWQGTDAFGVTSPAEWVSEAFSGVSLSPGDYYIGIQFENTNTDTKINPVASTGVDYIRFDGTFGTVPASLTVGTPDNTYSDLALDAYISF